jgi:hypothetical protein
MSVCFFRREPVGAALYQPFFNSWLGLGIGAMRRNSYTLTLVDICGCRDERKRVKLGMRRNGSRRRRGCKENVIIRACCLLLMFFHSENVPSKCEARSETQEVKKPYSTINKRR